MKSWQKKKKLHKLSSEAIINAIRLHFDSILLFNNKSYPSAFHIGVLTLEEIAKSNWIDHYVDSSITNTGFPDEDFEQKWLQLLYVHTAKQFAFINQEFHDLLPTFYHFVATKKLELKKQKSIYVGLERSKGKINLKSKISTPDRIKLIDAKQIISLNNDVLISICKRNIENGHYYGPSLKYNILNKDILIFLENEWTYKSGLRKRK